MHAAMPSVRSSLSTVNQESIMNMHSSIAMCVAVLLMSGNACAQSVMGTPAPDAPPPPAAAAPMDQGMPSPVMRLGVSGAYNLGLHSADAMTLPGIPSCCPGYTSTTGGGV